MDLIEAIKSGKKFHREGYDDFYDPQSPNWEYVSFRPHQILFDDYEIKEERVTVTRSQVEKTLNTLIPPVDRFAFEKMYGTNELEMFVTKFCKALGFSEK